MPLRSRLLTVGVAVTAVVGLLSPAAIAAPPPPPPAPDKTSALEARRVDRVPTPKLDWYECYGGAECTTVQLPLDYDQPKGATTEIAVLRVKARDQKNKIGSLFLNPGGPGGPGTSIAAAAPQFLGNEVLQKFDIVGFDPRGIGASANIRCFKSHREQTAAFKGFNVAFPWTKAEEQAYITSAKAVGKACSTTGKPLSGAMSTAEAARDMDVLRRAVGDKKLSYLGFSYGSVLGQYYANMFPDRVRAVAIDGVIDPTSWVGDAKTQNTILDDRLRSSDGAYKALREIMARCAKAGAELCPLAAHGDPMASFDLVAKRLRAKPLVEQLPNGTTMKLTYADFIGLVLFFLYMPFAGDIIAAITADLLTVTNPATPATAQKRAAAARSVAGRLAEAKQKKPGRDFPYENGLEAFLGVTCTDALHPRDASLWPALVAKSDQRAPYFGRAWAWSSAACARNTWTVRDEDAYRGPFNRRTSSPVLVVGNYWDPATNYEQAVSSAKLLPNSRLLSSDSWGHTAFGSSECVTSAMENYLLRVALPAKGTLCVGDIQPFVPQEEQRRATPPRTSRVPATITKVAPPAAGEAKQLPPVIPPMPTSPLR